jgi:hypothetical protein
MILAARAMKGTIIAAARSRWFAVRWSVAIFMADLPFI